MLGVADIEDAAIIQRHLTELAREQKEQEINQQKLSGLGRWGSGTKANAYAVPSSSSPSFSSSSRTSDGGGHPKTSPAPKKHVTSKLPETAPDGGGGAGAGAGAGGGGGAGHPASVGFAAISPSTRWSLSTSLIASPTGGGGRGRKEGRSGSMLGRFLRGVAGEGAFSSLTSPTGGGLKVARRPRSLSWARATHDSHAEAGGRWGAAGGCPGGGDRPRVASEELLRPRVASEELTRVGGCCGDGEGRFRTEAPAAAVDLFAEDSPSPLSKPSPLSSEADAYEGEGRVEIGDGGPQQNRSAGGGGGRGFGAVAPLSMDPCVATGDGVGGGGGGGGGGTVGSPASASPCAHGPIDGRSATLQVEQQASLAAAGSGDAGGDGGRDGEDSAGGPAAAEAQEAVLAGEEEEGWDLGRDIVDGGDILLCGGGDIAFDGGGDVGGSGTALGMPRGSGGCRADAGASAGCFEDGDDQADFEYGPGLEGSGGAGVGVSEGGAGAGFDSDGCENDQVCGSESDFGGTEEPSRDGGFLSPPYATSSVDGDDEEAPAVVADDDCDDVGVHVGVGVGVCDGEVPGAAEGPTVVPEDAEEREVQGDVLTPAFHRYLTPALCKVRQWRWRRKAVAGGGNSSCRML